MALDRLLKRHFWVIKIGLTSFAALLAARGVGQLVGVGLAASAEDLAAPRLDRRAPPAGDEPEPRVTSANKILHRNPFDSVTGPLDKVSPPPAGPEAEAPEVAIDDAVPPCDGVKVVVIAASSDPEWSFASFTEKGGKNLMRRRGGEVGTHHVKFIGWDRVWLTTAQNVLCQAQMFAPPPPPVVSTSGPQPGVTPRPPGGPPPVSSEIAKGIVKLSATEFNIDRGVVEKVLENQMELMRQAQIVPEQEGGRVVGLRLRGIRPDTLLGTLGMSDNDRLEKINGFDVTNTEKALEAYARVRTADHLTIQITRNGTPTSLDYNIK